MIGFSPNKGDLKMETQWNISFGDRGFENHSPKRGGKEVRINRTASWEEETVYIPSIYICSKGIILDMLIEVDNNKVWDFIHKYDLINDEYASDLTQEQHEEMENENPLKFDINTILTLNGRNLLGQGGSGCTWIPDLPENIRQENEAFEVLNHYGLDKTKAWAVRRFDYKWATVSKPKIKNLDLKIEQEKESVTAGYFENAEIGDEVKVSNPKTREEYTITIRNIENQSLKNCHFTNSEYDFPTELTEMTYTVSPEINRGDFRILDCICSDSPKPIKNTKPNDVQSISVGVIGGSDGPTAIITSSKNSENVEKAMSSLHFSKEYPIKWRAVFYLKNRDDIVIKLV